MDCEGMVTGQIITHLDREMGTTSWPGLQALYIPAIDRGWLQKLSTFENLRVLKVGYIPFGLPDFAQDVVEAISRCRSLQVIDIQPSDIDDPEHFLTIARGCPLLQRFCVSTGIPGMKMRVDQFSRLLLALPRVELLSLDVPLTIGAWTLRDINDHCPRLIVLYLHHTRLHISMEALVELPPLTNIRELYLTSIWFEKPRRYSQLKNLLNVAIEWKRVFPHLRRAPCYSDHLGPDICFDDDPVEGSMDGDDDTHSLEDEAEKASKLEVDAIDLDDLELYGDDNNLSDSLSEPDEYYPEDSDVDSDDDDSVLAAQRATKEDVGSVWFHMRRRLWKLLGYSEESTTGVVNSVHYLWQAEFEIKTFGWPVIGVKEFHDPRSYPNKEAVEVLDAVRH